MSMSEVEQAPAVTPPNKHEVLSWQLTNMTYIQRMAVEAALLEYAHLVERCRMLESENQLLTKEVARLTLKEVNGVADESPKPQRPKRERPRLQVRAR